MAYWLMKSEPSSYSWDDLVRDGGTMWDGVRNNAARLHLRAMKPVMRHSSITAWTSGQWSASCGSPGSA